MTIRECKREVSVGFTQQAALPVELVLDRDVKPLLHRVEGKQSVLKWQYDARPPYTANICRGVQGVHTHMHSHTRTCALTRERQRRRRRQQQQQQSTTTAAAVVSSKNRDSFPNAFVREVASGGGNMPSRHTCCSNTVLFRP